VKRFLILTNDFTVTRFRSAALQREIKEQQSVVLEFSATTEILIDRHDPVGPAPIPLTQLLVNLPATPISQIERWLPDQWKLRSTSPSG
jgi:hypothetical protein